MKIVLIGAGNVATILGRKFIQAGHSIVQVIARDASAASKLAYEWDTESANYLSLVNPRADCHLIAVSDDAIAGISADLKLPAAATVAHTAASVSREVLAGVSDHYGVFYPLQSLRREMDRIPDTPIFVDGNDAHCRQLLSRLARSISGEQVAVAGDDARLKLHVAAVFVSNFTNHLYALAESYCRQEGLDFTQLRPLIEETAVRIREASPARVQTGPAIRGDQQTIEKHLALLNAHPHLQHMYQVLSESIRQGS